MLTVKNLSYSNNQKMILSDISLSLLPEALNTLAGPSGVGKTTLLRLIAGLDKATTGVIEWRGEMMAGKGRWTPPWRRPFGMVFQDYALWPHLTVGQHLELVQKSCAKKNASTERLRREQLLSELKLSG